MAKTVKSESNELAPAKRKKVPQSKTKRKTRQDQLRTMLSRKNGATVDKIQSAFGWQPHSVRAAVSGLRKAGATIEKAQTPSGTAYRLVSGRATK